MICPNCGGEFGNGDRCQYCNSEATIDILRTRERLKKKGCPKCGSLDIRFDREDVNAQTNASGTRKRRRPKISVKRTVGYCKNCGYTWYGDKEDYENRIKEDEPDPKKAVWILGWTLCFPVPITILLARQKNLNIILKVVPIAAAWLLYLTLFVMGTITTIREEKTNAKIPWSSTGVTSVNYEDAVELLRERGFTNIEVRAKDDLVVGVFSKDGDVDHMIVDGDTTYYENKSYNKDCKIIIVYHTFPKKE